VQGKGDRLPCDLSKEGGLQGKLMINLEVKTKRGKGGRFTRTEEIAYTIPSVPSFGGGGWKVQWEFGRKP